MDKPLAKDRSPQRRQENMDRFRSIPSRLFDRTIGILSRALDFRSTNHHVIAGNLANIDTPGFRPKALSFDEELKRAAGKQGLSLRRTDPRHFGDGSWGLQGGFPLETMSVGPMDSEQLNLDAEMAKMMQNNLLYDASTRLLAKKFQALRMTIDSGKGQ